MIGLASKSPRRQQLLNEAKFRYKLVENDVEETFPSTLSPYQVASYLSEQKALHAQLNTQEVDLILSADSVVIIHDQVLGKPADNAEAFHMLKSLQDAWHVVVTGVTLRALDFLTTFKVETEVQLAALNHDEIEFYVQRFNPLDKAGAYGIQEWIGHCKVKNLRGSFTNVMGLPMHEVYEHLFDYYNNYIK